MGEISKGAGKRIQAEIIYAIQSYKSETQKIQK
jgi:hypothetical protein